MRDGPSLDIELVLENADQCPMCCTGVITMLQETLPGLFPDSVHSDFAFQSDLMGRGLSPQSYNLALMRWLETESKARMMLSADLVVRWISDVNSNSQARASVARIKASRRHRSPDSKANVSVRL